MIKLTLPLAATAASLLLSSLPAAAITTQPVLEDSDVAKVVAAAKAEMKKRDVKGCIAIDNTEGALIYFERQQGAYTNCNSSALAKAHTASMFRTKTDDFVSLLNDKHLTHLLAVPDLAPMPGGAPLKAGDTVVGGVGISTPDGNIDTPVAAAAAAALSDN